MTCRQDLFNSMLPKYHNIFQHDKDLRILIFSGDVDGSVPVMGTRSWLASLHLPIKQEWRPWYSLTGTLAHAQTCAANYNLPQCC